MAKTLHESCALCKHTKITAKHIRKFFFLTNKHFTNNSNNNNTLKANPDDNILKANPDDNTLKANPELCKHTTIKTNAHIMYW